MVKAVYCIIEVHRLRPVEFHHFKIGIASNVGSRLSSLQTGSPRQLRVLFSEWFEDAETARFVERRAHEYLSRFVAIGEWFRHDPEIDACPFEAVAVASSGLVPLQSDYFFEHVGPTYEMVLTQRPVATASEMLQ